MPPPVIAVDTRSERSRKLVAGGFVVTDTSYQPRVTAAHAHERDMCTITIDGAWQERRGRHVHDCSRGTAVVKGAGEVHTDIFLDPGMRVLVVEIDPATRLGTLRTCFGILERKAFLREDIADALGRRIVRELDEADASTPTIIEGLVLEMLGTMARLHGERGGVRHPLWLQRARELIHREFAVPLRVEDIARIVDVHPVRLTRGFRRYIGESPGEYMRRVRLEWTRVQLSSTDESVASIAARAGFADQSHFTRAFRRHTGVTPAVFRSATRHGRKS